MSLITEANISRIYIHIVYVHPLILYIYTHAFTFVIRNI